MSDKVSITNYFRSLQDEICEGLEKLDGLGQFKEDLWKRKEGGGGRSRVIAGDLIEKGGVNFSEVYGTLSDNAAKALLTSPGDFFATGVSIVLHPKNPWVPIIHMNVRYFELNENTWWFGGGIDVTPHYIDEKKARDFHQGLKRTCDDFSNAFYPQFKKQADDYFYIRHRQETRGIGGIFYDRLGPMHELSKAELFLFTKAVGEAFVPLYKVQVEDCRDKKYGQKELDWQSLRRGRYVEFNLVWDRGTKFGLETGGRTESILMSMPPLANWIYDHKPEIHSPEAKTLSLLKKGIDWSTHKVK